MTSFEVDEQIDEMIEQKNMNSSTVIGGRNSCDMDNKINSSGVRRQNAPKISIINLVRSLVPPDKCSQGGFNGASMAHQDVDK